MPGTPKTISLRLSLSATQSGYGMATPEEGVLELRVGNMIMNKVVGSHARAVELASETARYLHLVPVPRTNGQWEGGVDLNPTHAVTFYVKLPEDLDKLVSQVIRAGVQSALTLAASRTTEGRRTTVDEMVDFATTSVLSFYREWIR